MGLGKIVYIIKVIIIIRYFTVCTPYPVPEDGDSSYDLCGEVIFLYKCTIPLRHLPICVAEQAYQHD